MTEQSTPHHPPTASQTTARVLASFLAFVGILEMLRTGVSSLSEPVGMSFFGYPAHFMTGAVHLVAGLIGIWCATRAHLAAPYLTGLATLMVVWIAAGLALGGRPNDVFTRDGTLLVLHGVVALASVLGIVLDSRRRPAPGPTHEVPGVHPPEIVH